MTPRTFPAVLSRHSQHPLGCDYELPVVVTYEWTPADASGDATAEIVAVVDETGRDVHLTPLEELRLSRLAESYETNPVQVTRYALETWSGIGWSHVRDIDGYAAAFDAVRRYAAKGWTARVKVGDRIRPLGCPPGSSIVVDRVYEGVPGFANCGDYGWDAERYEVLPPAPSLSREDLAARFAVADYGAAMPTGGRGVVATNAVAMADALLSALSPPAAVAPVPEVTPSNHPATNDHGQPVRVGVSTGSAGSSTPAPVAAPVEAKRPTHVRVTEKRSPFVTLGKVYAVARWTKDGWPVVVQDDGVAEEIVSSLWEPCTPPSPEAPDARGEALSNAAYDALSNCVEALKHARDVIVDYGPKGSIVLDRIRRAIDAATRLPALSRPAATKGGAS